MGGRCRAGSRTAFEPCRPLRCATACQAEALAKAGRADRMILPLAGSASLARLRRMWAGAVARAVELRSNPAAPHRCATACQAEALAKAGRADRIRTCDLLNPIQYGQRRECPETSIDTTLFNFIHAHSSLFLGQ